MLRISLIGRVAVHVTARATCRAQTLRGGGGKYAHRDLVAHRNHAWTADGLATAHGIESLGASDTTDVPRGSLSRMTNALSMRLGSENDATTRRAHCVNQPKAEGSLTE